MSEQRTLVVTVGTSLFTSATWKCEGKIGEVRGYRAWTEELLEDPARRRSEGCRTADAVEKLLRTGTAITEDFFAHDFDHPLRYSGELATLIRCSQREGRGAESLQDFLGRRYSEIQLLAATHVDNPSKVAAQHLQVILRDKLGHPKVTMPETLRSHVLHELVGHLNRHFAELAASGVEVDLLVTGGYKAFSLLAGKFVASQPKERSWRALYVHEEALDHLFVEGRGETWVGQDKIATTRWPSPVGED